MVSRRILLWAWPLLAASASPVRAEDPGFGGSDDDAQSAAPEPSAEEACVVQVNGVWRSCADLLAEKEQKKHEDDPPPPDPEADALRERMKAADAAAAAAPPVDKTELEKELEKAHLDPKTPLIALRVDVARAEQTLARLEKQGRGGAPREAAEEQLAVARAILDDVERIAIHRMDVCLTRTGRKPVVKNFKMTAGGPVLLNTNQMMAQLPLIDPDGCERISLIDDALVARVQRRYALKKILATRSFGYHEVAERKALEKELALVEAELAKDAMAALSAPGVKDPYGRR